MKYCWDDYVTAKERLASFETPWHLRFRRWAGTEYGSAVLLVVVFTLVCLVW